MFQILYIFILLIKIEGSTEAKPPNIIFILADDLGWDDVSFHGSEIRTPNIDKLAKSGVILDNYYVQPLCTQSRGALLTGRYPIHLGLQHYVIVGSQPYGLPLTELTIANHLKSLGYSTHAIGKWHLGFYKDSYLPTKRGFDSHLGYYLGETDYYNHYTHDGGYMGYDFHKNGKALWNKSEVYSTRIYTERAEQIIKSHDQSTPLFMYLAHQGVHVGNAGDKLQAPQDLIDRYPDIPNWRRRIFAGMVAGVDDSVGRVYKALQDAGMADNTIIVFSTDNGGPSNNYDQNAACNWPLRGTKNTLWQGGVRGVGFVHSPLLNKTGYMNNNLMHITDWVPTLTAVAGGKPLSDLDGFNQWQTISNNKQTERKEVLLNIDPVEHHEALIVGDFKLIYGDISHHENDGWYLPPGQNDTSTTENKNSFRETKSIKKINTLRLSNARQIYNNEAFLNELINKINTEYGEYKMRDENILKFRSEKKVFESGSRNFSVHCGKKPSNASTNCQAHKHPCLYNIQDDPCEFNNLAPDMPETVYKLMERLESYKKSMIKPKNKKVDPKGNPQLHGGVWKPWL